MIDNQVTITHTREQALADGTLVDVSAIAREAGIIGPVAITAALKADVEAIPLRLAGGATYDGRLWDIVWMMANVLQSMQCGEKHYRSEGHGILSFPLIMSVGRKQNYRVKLAVSRGDDGHNVATLMTMDE